MDNIKKQIEETAKDLIEIFDEEYEKRRLITPQNTAEKMTAKGYRKASDVAEVRHGYWKEETEYYDDEYSECNVRKVFACSLCGRTERHREPYCNCGAKMDGERRTENAAD